MIRRAAIADVTAMGRIINDAAEYGLMLHRSPGYLYEHVRDFHVAQSDQGEHAGKVVGVCGLQIIWGNLAEIYALAVDKSQRGKGWGRQLVQACVEEAHALGIRKLMALTYEQRFFEHMGFHVVDRHSLPLKVWTQCVHCAKNQACDEIAVIREFEDIPEVAATPRTPPEGKYVVPTVRRATAPIAGPREKMDEAHWA